ncbi:unnamed protein product [Auanema sp. JU1783]|nr:unnamed protein product [Auanema sp. JU1783]
MDFLQVYGTILISAYSITTILILCKLSLGRLPHMYIRLIEYFQDSLTINKNMDIDNNNSHTICVARDHLTPTYFKKYEVNDSLDASIHLLSNGIQSILQDDISRPFLSAPAQGWWLLSWPTYFYYEPIPYQLISFYILGFVFRWFFLFPVRFALLLTSVIWIVACGLICSIFTPAQSTVMYFGITFARLFNASTGLVTRSHNDENRAQTPGIAVSNHLSANDIMVLYGDCFYDGKGYTVTGQSHKGFIETLQKFGSNLTPTLWLNREDQHQRSNFQKKVMDYSSQPSVYPVLLFPEGYCSNNDTILQFRKAVFTGEVPIYPIALLQNARVGDAFWKEDTYIPYMLRVMSSWATSYDITYLQPMIKKPSEDPADFAARVQSAVGCSIAKDVLPYDGGLKRQKDRLKYRSKVQTALFESLMKSST